LLKPADALGGTSGEPRKTPAFGLAPKKPAAPKAFDTAADMIDDDDDNGANEKMPYRRGVKVRHRIFGEGVVQGVEKSLDGYRLEVRFPLVGVKKLMHTYVTPIEAEDTL
jgi:hypothetical protein